MMHFIFKETTRRRSTPVNSGAGKSTGHVDQRDWIWTRTKEIGQIWADKFTGKTIRKVLFTQVLP